VAGAIVGAGHGMNAMRILVTNDDGIYSPGLAALAAVAKSFGDVRVVAPHVEMSSAAHSITSARPLTYKRTPFADTEAYRVNGTPADCVAIGVYEWKDANTVLSGINLGSNLGNSLWPSGTLAAARQAALMGLRGIAFSTPAGGEEADLEALKPWVGRVLGFLLPLPAAMLVNVNFPSTAPHGMRWTRQSVRHYDGRIVPGEDPMGRRHFWFTVCPVEGVEEGTDRWAVERGYVSMTPIRLDLTDDPSLEALRGAHQPADFAEAGAVPAVTPLRVRGA
jgi:5'-nucleotidase